MNPLPKKPATTSAGRTVVVGVGSGSGGGVSFHQHPPTALTAPVGDEQLPDRLTSAPPRTNNCDGATDSGWWSADGFTANTPAASAWVGQTITYGIDTTAGFAAQWIFEIFGAQRRIFYRTQSVNAWSAWEQIDRTFYDTRFIIVDTVGTGIMAVPTATAATGTASSGTTETRDAVLGDYVFTARAGRRYQVTYNGLILSSTIAADIYQVRIRNGGASTPTAASTLIAATAWRAQGVGGAGQESLPVSMTFAPGAGTVTLSAFTVRTTGTGAGTPLGTRELFVLDVGPV